MLPVNTGDHTAHQDFVTENLRKYYPNALSHSTRDIIERFWNLDLSYTDELLHGSSAFDVFQFLLLLVFQGRNLFPFLNSKKQDTAFSKNTYYRFLNETRFNWPRFITLLAVKVVSYFDYPAFLTL